METKPPALTISERLGLALFWGVSLATGVVMFTYVGRWAYQLFLWIRSCL